MSVPVSASSTVAALDKKSIEELSSTNKEPAWLKELRLSAFERYLEEKEPRLKDDEWRRTRVDSLDLGSISLVQPEGRALAGAGKRAEELLARLERTAGAIVISDEGTFKTELSPELVSKGVVFTDIAGALQDHEALLRKQLETSSSEGKTSGRFNLITQAMFSTGVFLHIPADVSVDAPFVIVDGFSSARKQKALFSRLIISVGTGAKASVINLFTSHFGQGSTGADTAAKKPEWSLASALVEIGLESSARLDYLEIQDFSQDVFSITRNINSLAADSSLYSLNVGAGGGQLKSDIFTHLSQRGAHADVMGVVLGDQDEHVSFNTIQDHAAPDTTSNIDYRIALKDRSVSAYQGNIVVAKAAQKTNAMQTNKNLILGAEARADSIPRLEILADDVKCSHGATVGPVDREQVFYLMSRGLPEAFAEELIVGGFFNTVLETCKIEGAQDWVIERVREKIHGAEVTGRGR